MHIAPEIRQLARRLAEELKELEAAKRHAGPEEFSPEDAEEVFRFDLEKWILREQLAGNLTLAPKPPAPEDADETPTFLAVLYGENQGTGRPGNQAA